MLETEYPKKLSDNLKYRTNLLSKANKDYKLQAVLKECCRRDRLFFFNVFAWTYNPRKRISHLPFITYHYQDTAILKDAQFAVDQVDNIVEKSRDMGATWIFVVNDFYDWLFSPEKIEIKWGSRKEDYVDKSGDMDSIFEKFRYLYRNLPKWMLPKRFNAKQHDNHMRFINPETKSSITGEATNANFGRGGRKYRIRFDEFAFWDVDEPAWSACADSTNCRTALSTPNGSSNKFALLAKDPHIEKIIFHWTMHPEKVKGSYYLNNLEKIPIDIESNPMRAFEIWQQNRDQLAPEPMLGSIVRSKWYDAQCERRNKAKEIAQELDIDYHMSGSPFFNLRKLDAQQAWTCLDRPLPDKNIPHGYFVRADVVKLDQSYQIREKSAGWLKVYEYPKFMGQYILSGDTAEGLEKSDETVGVVRDKYTRNVVAVFNGQFTPEDHAEKLFKLSKAYNDCKIAPENNNHGYSVCSDLSQMECDLYVTYNINEKTGAKTPSKKGFTTSTRSRPKALDQFAEEIENEIIELRDADLISQCKTFINNPKGKPEADGDFLDDLVMCCAIGSHVIDEYPYTKPKPKKRPRRTSARRQNAGIGFS